MKTTKVFLMFASVALLSVGCSKDDDGNGGKSNFSDAVPSGEIVPVEMRNEVLTGFADVDVEAKGLNQSQKWWESLKGEFISKNCPEYNDSYEYEDSYFALFPNGEMYRKFGIDGTPMYDTNWRWTSSAKEAIELDRAEGVSFYFTYLNEENVVYASKQSAEGCTAETYEQFHNPHFD